MAKTASVKTVKKLEGGLNMRLSYDLPNGKVCRLYCETCYRWEKDISSCKNFSPNWIHPGTENASKGSAFCVFRGV